jgi:hypothetical protein
MSASALLAELERARALGVNPSSSSLWVHAPWGLRNQFSLGFIDAQTFWLGLEHWFQLFEEPSATAPFEPEVAKADAPTDPHVAGERHRLLELAARATRRGREAGDG